MKVEEQVRNHPVSRSGALNRIIYLLDQNEKIQAKRSNLMKSKEDTVSKIERLKNSVSDLTEKLSKFENFEKFNDEEINNLKLEFSLTNSEILELQSSLLRQKIIELQKKEIHSGESEI